MENECSTLLAFKGDRVNRRESIYDDDSTSTYSESDYSEKPWEVHVEDNGTLFYCTCSSGSYQEKGSQVKNDKRNVGRRSATKKSSNKITKLIKQTKQLTVSNVASTSKQNVANQFDTLSAEKNLNSESHKSDYQLTSLSMYADQIHHMLSSHLRTNPEISIICLVNDLTSNDNQKNIVFCYPCEDQNVIYGIRGALLTLRSVTEYTFKSMPSVTTVAINGIDHYITFDSLECDLCLIVGYSSVVFNINEVKAKSDQIIRSLNFNLRPIDLSTTSLLLKVFATVAISNDVRINHEYIQPEMVFIPREAKMRIEDSINEMEATDYFNLMDNESVQHKREFYIIGSALYYKHHLLASHLANEDLFDLECDLRSFGIFKLLESYTIRELIYWKEVFPSARNSICNGRWFLSIVVRHQLLLATIFELHDEIEQDNYAVKPSPRYVDEMEETILHLHSQGITSLAASWIYSNKRPQCITDQSLLTIKRQHGNVMNPFKKLELGLKRFNENIGLGEYSTTRSSIGSSSVKSENSYHRDESDTDSDWGEFGSSRKSSEISQEDSDFTDCMNREILNIIPSKISSGLENLLIEYCLIDLCNGHQFSLNGICCISKIYNKICGTLKRLHKDHATDGSHSNEIGSLMKFHRQNEEDFHIWITSKWSEKNLKILYVCHRTEVLQDLNELTLRLNQHTYG